MEIELHCKSTSELLDYQTIVTSSQDLHLLLVINL